MKKANPYRFLFAGGGTGGHLYPALAVAQQIRLLKPESEILFVGAGNKIESKVVPEYGFDFRAIWISGFSRNRKVANLLFPVKLMVSAIQSLAICFRSKPSTAIGSGAYASGPVIWASSVIGAKIILLEQNSYPGITNRMLERKAAEIHIAFEESRKYFRDGSKVHLSGNPVRVNLKLGDKPDAKRSFGLDGSGKTLLIIGGSGGAAQINRSIASNLDEIRKAGLQIIWQTGRFYYDGYKKYQSASVKILPFINDMGEAYSACDLLIARSGATTIAEVSFLGVPAVFIPSSNVAANHQYFNAKALKEAGAAELIEDKYLDSELMDVLRNLINDEGKLNDLKKNIAALAKPEAAKTIAERAIRLAEEM
jgi:UDP-N-acetylglucosamine--N-acetylmuramyl-(pentapeptide) pyrophosphoryl-undecaprenol N-acetylglucosamine transferase